MAKKKRTFRAPKFNPADQIKINTSFTSPKGSKCQLLHHVPNSNLVEVKNLQTGEVVKIDYSKIEHLLPKWDVNNQKNI